MSTMKTLQAVVLSASAFVATPTYAGSQATTSPCILHQHRVASVKPYLMTESLYNGRMTRQALRGAELFVPAEPGLTSEWLQLTIARHINEMRAAPGMPNCPLSVADVTVQVESAGTGFTVRLLAPSGAKAQEVLRRAELLRV